MKNLVLVFGLLFGATLTSFSQWVNVRNVTGCQNVAYQFELITNTSTCASFLASSGVINNCNTFTWQLTSIYSKYRFRYSDPNTLAWSDWYGNVPGCSGGPTACYSGVSLCNGASSIYSYTHTVSYHNYMIFHGNSCSLNDCY